MLKKSYRICCSWSMMMTSGDDYDDGNETMIIDE
jgi:hypothetical protein